MASTKTNNSVMSMISLPTWCSTFTVCPVLATRHIRPQKRQLSPSNFAGAIRLFPPSSQGLAFAGNEDQDDLSICSPSVIRLIQSSPSSPALLLGANGAIPSRLVAQLATTVPNQEETRRASL
jgi:hypothetical protein